ncbi:unnamed protein product [Arctogadus glacialis]
MMFLLVLSLFLLKSPCTAVRNVYSNHWAVRIAGGPGEADHIAAKYGYTNLGQIGGLEDHYHFHHSRVVRRAAFALRGDHSFIHMDPRVDWAQQQLIKARVKRHVSPDPNAIHFNDPKWANMWYIGCASTSSNGNSSCRSGMNVMAAWQRGYTGRNVVVTILDDGIERNHPDLAENYDQLASYDVNGNDHDPTPRYDSSNENIHGTRCAGEVAAVANNSYCIVGIAFNARIGGIRMLDGDVTDLVEAKSLGIRTDYIDIYSASWGPKDDGKTVEGPGPLAKLAFENGIKKGRKGLGSIFVWASGNGGQQADHCSCDGYTNSIYTISISSTTEKGNRPWYLEVCSSILAATYSSAEFHDRRIVTTDLRHRCTDGHTGTSVSAPMVAGIIALALEANPLLGWRDVQHLLVKTSRPVHLKACDWKTNSAGHKVSHLYGFGLVDAEAMVVEAKRWRSVPPQHTCRTSERHIKYIRAGQSMNSTISTSGCSAEGAGPGVAYLEHVVVKVLLLHPRRGDLEIELVSPAGTRSQLLARRANDNSNEGFRNWEFMTVHCWGERAEGNWTLEIRDVPSARRNLEVLGKFKEWTLTLHGTWEHPYQSHEGQSSQSRTPEVPSPGLVPGDPAQALSGPEDLQEDEYNGPCHDDCAHQGCYGPDSDHCLNCIHFSLGTLKSGRTCVSHCPAGYFPDPVVRRCRRCQPGCEQCSGCGSAQCLACRRGFYLNGLNSTCTPACPPGYYGDDGQGRCLKCKESCTSCVTDADQCTGCRKGYRLAGMTCVLECGYGSFFNLEEMQCLPCQPSCATCTGPGQGECNQCALGYHQQEWLCVQHCSAGYYSREPARLRDKMCRKCEDNCVSCEGPGASCTQCREGFSLISRTCLAQGTCNNADEVFCDMVKSNRLCEKKLFRQFCCRTCLMTG